jgi:hypothetical protein
MDPYRKTDLWVIITFRCLELNRFYMSFCPWIGMTFKPWIFFWNREVSGQTISLLDKIFAKVILKVWLWLLSLLLENFNPKKLTLSLVTLAFEKLYIFWHLIILFILAMSSVRKILMKNYSVNKGLKLLLTDKSWMFAGQPIAIEKQSRTAFLDTILIIIQSCITFYIFLLTIRVCDSVFNCTSITKVK